MRKQDSAGARVVYLHGDHLGSLSAATSAGGVVLGRQEYTPWGARRGTEEIAETVLDFTGQRKDEEFAGLIFFNARYYDPVLGRFLSADSIVPGAEAGSGGAAATVGSGAKTNLTVDFHETGFVSQLNGHNAFTQANGFWFQLSGEAREDAEDPARPSNPQALNRYAYTLNNPLKYTDPTGHCPMCAVGGVFLAGSAVCGPLCGAVAVGATLVAAAVVGNEVGKVVVNASNNAMQAKASERPATGERPKGYRKGVTEQVRAKNDGKCVYCDGAADTNDHDIPWKDLKQGAINRGEELDRYNDVDNLLPACRSCNSSKGAKPRDEYEDQRR